MNTAEAVLFLLENNLNFAVQVELDQATEILGKCSIYNEIPDTISELPRALANAIGPVDFGGDNPNNGGFSNLRLKIGNEGSMVVYLDSNTFYRKGDSPERQKAAIEAVAATYKADEITVEIKTYELMGRDAATVKARLWWD
jgi:hypothetical protein